MSPETPKAQTQTQTQKRPTIASAVQEMYTDVAVSPTAEKHFPVGRTAAEFVGYPQQDLDPLPPQALESFAGVGNPFQSGAVRENDTVLDIGSGSGTDLLIAARRVGENGRAFGLDFTQAMMTKTLATIEKTGTHQAFVLYGDAGEKIPLPDESVDVVTSNGVINLIPDKARAFEEIHRVLKPGGRLQLADIVVNVPVADACRANPELWAACITGAEVTETYLDTIRNAGFQDVQVLERIDYFDGSPSQSAKKTASDYKAESIVLTARKGSP